MASFVIIEESHPETYRNIKRLMIRLGYDKPSQFPTMVDELIKRGCSIPITRERRRSAICLAIGNVSDFIENPEYVSLRELQEEYLRLTGDDISVSEFKGTLIWMGINVISKRGQLYIENLDYEEKPQSEQTKEAVEKFISDNHSGYMVRNYLFKDIYAVHEEQCGGLKMTKAQFKKNLQAFGLTVRTGKGNRLMVYGLEDWEWMSIAV